MPQFGFLIDNRKCIGCHACSTACKSENEVPIGVNRTWVKYVEKGAFPDTRRFFQVTRCNHCANPPCVHICPTTAMFQRPDGIVEFDSDRCIGCKACMQACPYDAIYIDPDSHTAAKCHFCAHRTEVGLEPACVVVCPEHAIISGDIEDAGSEISQLLRQHQVRARKPEQNTLPKLWYIDAEESSIIPGAADPSGGQLWAQHPNEYNSKGHKDWRGPISIGEGNAATAMMRSTSNPRETYNAPHRVPWHWQVPAYLVTKSIGAGAFIVGAAGIALGLLPDHALFTTIASFVAIVFIAATTGLLVWDLDRPDRFWTILIRPQWRSWLTRGAFILIGFSGLAGLFLLGQLLGFEQFAKLLIWPGVVLAVLSAVYTAWLFGQAEGRDLWQSAQLPWHLFVQALMTGSGALLLLAFLSDPGPEAIRALGWTFGASVLVNLLITIGGEFSVPHASQVASAAAHMIRFGRYSRHYRTAIWLGLVMPLLLTWLGLTSTTPLPLLAGGALLAIVGMFFYEWAFVMAPQDVPNS